MRYARRKVLLVSATAAAWIMVTASTAFACTVFAGLFQVKGNASTTAVTARGTGGSMVAVISSKVAKATASNGSFRVKTRYNSTDGNKLPAATYSINFGDGAFYSDHYNWSVDCMNDQLDDAFKPVTTVGTVVVNSTGVISSAKNPAGASLSKDGKGFWGPFRLPNPSKTTNGVLESAVCISTPAVLNQSPAYGNQAPITIL